MSVPTLPYPLTDGTFAYGSQVYADLSALLSALNANLDSSNMNLTRGIGANYITRGAFQSGAYSFTAAAVTDTPLQINGLVGQTANIAQINSGATMEVWVDQNGILNTAQTPIFAGSVPITLGALSGLSPIIYNGAGQFSISANPAFSNVSVTGVFSGPSAVLSTQVNIGAGTAIASTAATFGGAATFAGSVQATPNDGTNVKAAVSPVKDGAGNPYGVNLREYAFNAGISVSAQPAFNLVGVATITWPVAFTSASSYAISATCEGGAFFAVISSKFAGSANIAIYNIQATGVGTVYVDLLVIGQ